MKNPSIIIIALCIFLTSCLGKIDPPVCIVTLEAPVSAVTGANSTTVNNAINLNVSFPITNGCGSFSTFNQAVIADTTIVRVLAKYEGCTCTQVATTGTATYIFSKPTPGRYYIKFRGDTSFVTKIVTVL